MTYRNNYIVVPIFSVTPAEVMKPGITLHPVSTHCVHEQSINQHLLVKWQAKMLYKVTHCVGRFLVNNRPHWLHFLQVWEGSRTSHTLTSSRHGILLAVSRPRLAHLRYGQLQLSYCRDVLAVV